MDLNPKINQLAYKLAPLQHETDYLSLFEEYSAKLSNNELFILKVEIERLLKPCQFIIDMSADAQCTLHKEDGLTHKLTEPAIELFDKLICKFYDGYNFYIYERLCRQFSLPIKQISYASQRQKLEIQKYINSHIKFACTRARCEERVNYRTTIELIFKETVFTAKTINVSRSGIKLQTESDCELARGDILTIRFIDWQENAQDARKPIFLTAYKVAWIRNAKQYRTMGMIKIVDEENKPFIEHLDSYLIKIKNNYQLNVSDTLISARNILFEQYYFYGSPSVPVLIQFDEQGDTHIPFIIEQESNAQNIQYWNDEQNICQLRQIFTPKRIKQMLTQLTPVKSVYLYCFTYKQHNKKHYFSATNEELTDELLNLYWSYGANKPSWRVYKIELHDLDLNSIKRPVCIPSTSFKEIAIRNNLTHPEIMHSFGNTTHFALLIDVTNKIATSSYIKQKLEPQAVNDILCFKMEKLIDTQTQIIKFESPVKKQVKPYLFNSPLTFSYQDKTQEQALLIKGNTVLLAKYILKLNYKGECQFALGDPLTVEIGSSAQNQINTLSGTVAKFDPTARTIHLKISNTGSEYYQSLKRNMLVFQKVRDVYEPMHDALRNLCIYSTSQSSCFVSWSESEPVCQVVESSAPSRLSAMIEKFKHHCEQSFEDVIITYINNKMSSDNKENLNLNNELLLTVEADKIKPIAWLNELPDEKIRKITLVPLLENGCVWVIRLEQFVLPKTDYREVELEMGYLSLYSPAALRPLQQYLTQFNLGFTLVDITQEVMARHGVSTQKMTDNHQTQNEFIFDVLS